MALNELSIDIKLASSSRVADTYYSDALKIEDVDRLVCLVDVTAILGTLDVTVQTTDSYDSGAVGAIWYDIVALAQKSATGNYPIPVARSDGLMRHVRTKNIIAAGGCTHEIRIASIYKRK